MEDQTSRRLVIPDPKLRKLAFAKLWAELHTAHKIRDRDLVEEIEYGTLMIYMACHQVLKVLDKKEEETEDHNL